MKRYLVFILIIGILCFTLSGCRDKDSELSTNNVLTQITPEATGIASISVTPTIPTISMSESNRKDYPPTEEYVKLLGRTYFLGDILWLSQSASGIEFTFTGTKADITLKGDNIAIGGIGDTHFCRVSIYVDGESVSDELLTEKETTITAFESKVEKTVTISVIKLSEASESTFGISNISVVAKDTIRPTAARAHRIEFIGDSITCGFGVDDVNSNGTFTTSTEDVTKTYAYLTAQSLKADYSLFCISGYGIISGFTTSGQINTNQLIPTYYDTMGFSYGYFNCSIPVNSINWDFSSFEPELIVINLGTNDSSYCGNDPDKQKDFTEGYTAFLKHLREKNQNATILCTLGIMGDSLYVSMEEAMKQYCDESGDKNIYCMKFDPQQASDGYGACWHPSAITHEKAADKLTDKIKSIMGW
jgi:hypothetical protein